MLSSGFVSPSAFKPSRARASVRALCLAGCGTLFILSVILARLLRLRCVPMLQVAVHRVTRRIVGIEVQVYGSPISGGSAVFVCNHVSYLDVPVLGSTLRGSFVAKADVAGWPVVGYLCRLQDTVFIDRRARAAREQCSVLADRLQAGDQLVLFPEGTSSDGNRALSFKSSLFHVTGLCTDGPTTRVQPVSLAYSRLNGMPMGRWLRPFFAWYGDMTLVDHLWRVLGVGGVGVDLIFHDPVHTGAFADRKELARYCQQKVAEGVSNALSGRLSPPQTAPLERPRIWQLIRHLMPIPRRA